MSTNTDEFTPLGRITNALMRRGTHSSSATIIRPDDATQYGAGDAIYPAVPTEGDQIASMLFSGVFASPGGTAILTNASLVHFAAEATRLDAALWLFKAPLATPPVDNEPFTPSDDDMLNWVNTIDFDVSAVRTAGNVSVYKPQPYIIIEAGETTDLHGYLVTANAYTPTASEKLVATLATLDKDISIF